MTCPVSATAVQFWRPHILRYVPNPSGGVDFWLAWVARESCGNPCSFTYLHESGAWQLDPGNMATAGTSESALRAACIGSTQTKSRALTDDEIREQVLSFQRYLDWAIGKAREKLSAAGVPWSESSPSFWMTVKLVHAYPAPIVSWLTAATKSLGRPPSDFVEFARTVPSNFAGILNNAMDVGSAGTGAGAIPVVIGALVVGGGLLYYLLRRKRRF